MMLGASAMPKVAGLGPRPVDLAPQAGGTTRTANSTATIVSQVAASAGGDTVVIAPGTYGYVDLGTKSIASPGFVRVIPEIPGTVTVSGVEIISCQGIDIRGINTIGNGIEDGGPTEGVWIQQSSRIRFRGGAHSHDPDTIVFMVHRNNSDIIIEDVTVKNGWVSFYTQSSTEANRSTNVTIQRVRSENVDRDHFFGSYGDNITLQDFEFFGHTESTEHSDGIQLAGVKNSTFRRGHIWNTRAFRDGAIDRNDHGVLVNYTPLADARVPENIVFENLLIHDQTSHGITVAGIQNGCIIRNCTAYDNGLNGATQAINTDPDSTNVVTGLQVINCVFSKWTDSGEITFTTNTNNFVADNTGPTGTNRLTGSPGFVDSTNQNYNLTSGSQNRGSGTATGAATDDLYGRARPSPPSRGALETP